MIKLTIKQLIYCWVFLQGGTMKKFLSLSLTMVLMLSSTITVLAQEAKPNNDDYLSISDYNNVYQQTEDDNLLSLDSYNQKYANGTLKFIY